MNKTTENILAALHETDDFVSGQQLCRTLNVSRAAVSKQIQTLRSLGYDIESIPRHGHRLLKTPDLPLAMEVKRHLTTARIGQPYCFLKETTSTNSYLNALSETQDGMVVVADRQTAGRGRLQREWHSPAGVNLYVSILLTPQKPPSTIPPLALITALSVVRALTTVTPNLAPVIKWPNDILINGRKLAGILCEMQAESDVVHNVILGIGLNVNTQSFPAPLNETATSLLIETQTRTNRATLLAHILNQLDRDYAQWLTDGLAPSLPALTERLWPMGQHVTVDRLGHTIEGTVTGLSEDGGLQLDTHTGIQTIHSGEVIVTEPSA